MSEDDDGQCESGGRGSHEVDCEAPRTNNVDEGQQQPRHEQGPEREQRDEAHPAHGLARICGQRLALLQAPVAELGGGEQPGREERGSAIERRVVHRELRRVHASEEEERHRKEHRPAESQRCNKRQKRENGNTKPDLDQGFVLYARERKHGHRGRARDGPRARD